MASAGDNEVQNEAQNEAELDKQDSGGRNSGQRSIADLYFEFSKAADSAE
nr:hypothetical protein [Corynebacterium lactis]